MDTHHSFKGWDFDVYWQHKSRYKTRNNLKLYKEKEIESAFLEIIEPNNKKDKITGCIYKHPIVPVTEFTNNSMGPLLKKLFRDKKEIILMGDFNINILKCDSEKDTGDFVDTIYASLLYPTINTPTRIATTSKTLIDNIFYNDFTKNNYSWKHSYFYL